MHGDVIRQLKKKNIMLPGAIRKETIRWVRLSYRLRGGTYTHIYIIVVANAVHADPGCQLSVVGGTVAQEIA